MRKVVVLCITLAMYYTTSAQIMAGASFGTFNIPGAPIDKVKGFGPTIKLEYIMSDRTSSYLDASLYNAKEYVGKTTITDAAGDYKGDAETIAHYSIKHLQLGFKALFGKDFSEKGFAFFLGGGVAASLVKTTYKYTLTGYDISDSKFNNSIFGFHFHAGVHYNFNPIIVELKSNFDLMLKPLVSGESYIIVGSRLGVLIPLTKG